MHACIRSFLKKIPFLQKMVISLRGYIHPNSVPKLPEYCCFSSSLVSVNDPFVQQNWRYLECGYDEESYIKDSIQIIRNHTMVMYRGLASLAYQIKYLKDNNISGSIVETGTWKGGSAALMSIFCQHYFKEYPAFHLFDSWCGIPQPQKEKDYMDFMDKDWRITEEECNGCLVPTGALESNQQDTEEAMFKLANYPKNKVHFYKGWFQDTVPQAAQTIGSIALLRLDGDLYESTMVCLKHLYPLVSPGGIIVIDDWCLKGCRLACEEFFEEIGIKPFVHHVDGCTHYIIKN